MYIHKSWRNFRDMAARSTTFANIIEHATNTKMSMHQIHSSLTLSVSSIVLCWVFKIPHQRGSKSRKDLDVLNDLYRVGWSVWMLGFVYLMISLTSIFMTSLIRFHWVLLASKPGKCGLSWTFICCLKFWVLEPSLAWNFFEFEWSLNFWARRASRSSGAWPQPFSNPAELEHIQSRCDSLTPLVIRIGYVNKMGTKGVLMWNKVNINFFYGKYFIYQRVKFVSYTSCVYITSLLLSIIFLYYIREGEIYSIFSINLLMCLSLY